MTNTAAPKTEGLTFDAALEQAKAEVDRILFSAPVVVRTYTTHLQKARGKFIRTYALLAAAMEEDGSIDKDAISLAAAIEILHLATLVHDDVMDNAEVRRGIPTISKKYGRKTAVICGDYLLSAALREAMEVFKKDRHEEKRKAGHELPDYVSQICMGEMRQHINNGNLELSVYRYLSIISGKTAALFEAAVYGGAIFCEKEEKRLRQYRMFGRYLGMIFQLTDDCIDFEMDEGTAKKNVQSDYEQGVITLPLIHAFQENSQFKEKAALGTMTREEMNEVVEKTGGLSFTRAVSKRYFDKAVKQLETLSLSEKKKALLVEILEKAYYGLKKKA